MDNDQAGAVVALYVLQNLARFATAFIIGWPMSYGFEYLAGLMVMTSPTYFQTVGLILVVSLASDLLANFHPFSK